MKPLWYWYINERMSPYLKKIWTLWIQRLEDNIFTLKNKVAGT